MEQLLSVNQAAELLGTTVRFPRRLVAERRVRFIHVGRHVRIPLSALEDLIRDGTVEPAGASALPLRLGGCRRLRRHRPVDPWPLA